MPRNTLNSKGKITLPREIRDGTVIVEPETIDIKSLRGVVKRRGKKKVSIEGMNAAVRRGASGR